MPTKSETTTAASSAWEQATLWINGNKMEGGAEPVLLRGQENVVTVEAPPELARALNFGLPEDGGLNIVASPNFGEWVAPVNGKFNWKITPDAGKSGRVTLVFFSREVKESWEHRSLVISSNLADEADIKIADELEPPLGYVFFWERSQIVTLTPKANSPMAGLPVRLTYDANGSEVQNYLLCTPEFNIPQTNYSWTVRGHNSIGTFQLCLAAEGLATPISAACSLISDDMARNVEPRINGQPFTAQKTLNINETYELSLFWRNNVPGNIPLQITNNPGSNIIVNPPVYQATYTHSWTLTCTTATTWEPIIGGPSPYLPKVLKLPKLNSR